MKKILSLFTALILFGSMTVKADYYVAGSMNGWNAGHSDYNMSGSDPYSVTKQLNSGDYQFKITQGSWSWSSNSYDQSASNVELSIKDGNIAFSLSTNSDVTFSYNASTGKAYVQATPVVVPSYTFTNGTTIYYDFTAYGSGVNVCINGGEPWHENTSAIFCETLSSAWEVTATTNLFKSAPNGWSYKTCSTLPTEGQNMLVGDANGVDCHWDTYSGGMPEPTPATIQLHSNITNPSWESSANFALAGNEETASLTLTGVTKGNYEFGVKIDGTWTSNGSAFTRDNNSHAVVAGGGNCTFNADRNGDYTFTWTYATNTLAVTYPAVPAQSVTFNSLASEILKGSVINLANCVTSSGIDDPTYRFYIKEKNGSYGDAINANYTFNANGEYVVKVEALEYGEPVAYDESAVVVYQSYTFTNGTTIYVDFSAMTEGGKGVNYPKVNEVGVDYDGAGAGTIKTIAFTANVTWTTMAEAFIKTEKNGWANLPFTVPGIGENCAVVAADGASYTWTTYVAPPPTIKMHGNFLGGWDNTDAFVLAGNNETASLTLNIQTKGEKEFGVRIGSDDNWTSNGASFTRANASQVVTVGEGNCKLNVDAKGDYTFTWTFASNTLSVTYPALPAQSVAFDGLAAQILKGTNVVFAATSSGIDNPGYRFYVKPQGGEYGVAVTEYNFDALGQFEVKVEALEDNTGEPVASDVADVVVYDAHTFTNGTTIYVDFSAMTEGDKGVNYPKANEVGLDYDVAGAGTFKTVTLSADVEWTTNDVFIKTEKAGWAELKFTVPGSGENCAVVAADGASFTWSTHTTPAVTVEAMGEWDGWTDALEFVPDGSGLTATATKHFDAGNYDFKLIVDGNWLSNANAFHRFWTSASGITSNNDENMQLQADADGDYVFTWTYATNAIAITFPETPKTGTNEVKFFPPRTEEHPWDNVYVYAWRRTSGGDVRLSENEWPGDPATKDGEWYKITVEKGACVVFNDNNNGMQSFDIENVQKDVCYIANEIVDGDPIKAKFYESCTVNYFLTSGDEAIMGAGNAWKADLAERQLDGSNEITLTALPAGIYEFKLTNGSWAWSLGGKEHLNGGACSSAAVTSGNGNVKFKIESAQDVTISYNPATQKICLSAETVLPFEDVRTGLTADNYYTVCFNREMKQIRGASLWSFIGRDADFAYIVQESAPFAAGKPYVLFAESEKLEAILDREVSAPVANGALHGTFSLLDQTDLDVKKAAAGDKDVYLVIGNELRRATGTGTGGNSLPAYRAYVIVDEIDLISTPSPAPGKKVRSMPMQKDQAQGFENLQTSDKPVKVVIDGALYILRGENIYDATGRMVK